MSVTAPTVGLRVLSIALGVFLVGMGLDKTAWLMDGSILVGQLQGFPLDNWYHPFSEWYVNTVALPGAPVFARFVLLGELATGVALILGYRVRMTASIALLMILNFHVAAGLIFNVEVITNGYGLPLYGGFVALVAGATRLPFSVPA